MVEEVDIAYGLSVQQSEEELQSYPNSVRQLLFPQEESPAHSLWPSQSPLPTLQGLEVVQQSQFNVSSPEHKFTDTAVVSDQWKKNLYKSYLCL